MAAEEKEMAGMRTPLCPALSFQVIGRAAGCSVAKGHSLPLAELLLYSLSGIDQTIQNLGRSRANSIVPRKRTNKSLRKQHAMVKGGWKRGVRKEEKWEDEIASLGGCMKTGQRKDREEKCKWAEASET